MSIGSAAQMCHKSNERNECNKRLMNYMGYLGYLGYLGYMGYMLYMGYMFGFRSQLQWRHRHPGSPCPQTDEGWR